MFAGMSSPWSNIKSIVTENHCYDTWIMVWRWSGGWKSVDMSGVTTGQCIHSVQVSVRSGSTLHTVIFAQFCLVCAVSAHAKILVRCIHTQTGNNCSQGSNSCCTKECNLKHIRLLEKRTLSNHSSALQAKWNIFKYLLNTKIFKMFWNIFESKVLSVAGWDNS